MAIGWFVDRPSAFEGIQWQGDNVSEMNDWADRYNADFVVNEDGSGTFINENGPMLTMAVGDWWMQNRSYTFTNEQVESKYQQVSNTTLTYQFTGS